MAKGILSELDAVNAILASVGDTPVQTLEDPYMQATLARQVLQEVSRDVQEEGWWFNTENINLKPNEQNKIVLPYSCLRLETYNRNVTQRGKFLYNKADRSYKFENPVNVDMIYLFDWEYLPPVAAAYITNRAKLQFNNSFNGDESLTEQLSLSARDSLIRLKQTHIKNSNINIIRNQRSYSILHRNRRR